MDCLWYQNVRDGIHAYLHDYERLQNSIAILIYIQIGCSLIGSLGALYNGVSLISLWIALFSLIAVASGSGHLIRIYSFLLFCTILLDISWFIFFSYRIWNMSSEEGTGMSFIISLRLMLAVEILGFCVRFISSLFWVQLYRMVVSQVDIGALAPENLSNSRQFSDDTSRDSFNDPTANLNSPFEGHQQPSISSSHSQGHSDGVGLGRNDSSGSVDSLLNLAPVRRFS